MLAVRDAADVVDAFLDGGRGAVGKLLPHFCLTCDVDIGLERSQTGLVKRRPTACLWQRPTPCAEKITQFEKHLSHLSTT